MEKFNPLEPNIDDKEKKSQEVVKNMENFNFPEMMEFIKPAITEVVKQLKTAIENGEYDTLISDDAKGRIPTLILREILKRKAPNPDDIKTVFLAFGRSWNNWDSSLSDFVEEHKNEWGKALVVTEYIHEGGTMGDIISCLGDNGFDNFDITSMFSKFNKEDFFQLLWILSNKKLLCRKLFTSTSGLVEFMLKDRDGFKDELEKNGIKMPENISEDTLKGNFGGHNIFVGEKVSWAPKFFESDKLYSRMTGVRRRVINSLTIDDYTDSSAKYSIGTHPERLDKLLKNPEPTFQQVLDRINKLGGYKDNFRETGYLRKNNFENDKKELEKLRGSMEKETISEEKKIEIQEDINKGREDIDVLVGQIIDEVWGKE